MRARYCNTSSREVTRPERNAAGSSGIVASTTVELRSLGSAKAVAHTTRSASVRFIAADLSSFLGADAMDAAAALRGRYLVRPRIENLWATLARPRHGFEGRQRETDQPTILEMFGSPNCSRCAPVRP